MEKNAVLGNESKPFDKQASRQDKCPICGSNLDMDGSLPRCPIHGTKPFEARSYIERKSRG
jgi:hypothetical protein